MTRFRTIVVPHDFSETADRALDAACDLASDSGATVHLIHVEPPPAYAFAGEAHAGLSAYAGVGLGAHRDAVAASRARLQAAARAASLPTHRIQVRVVEASGVPRSIVAVAEELGADLIVMGTHGRTGLAHLLMGSVAEETLRNASCPVLAVPLQTPPRPELERFEASRHPPLGAL